MNHAELTPDQAREILYDIMRRDSSFQEKAQEALALGRSYLRVDNGHVTRIEQDSDSWETIVSTDGPDGQFPPGLRLDLGTTYCRRTITADAPIAFNNVPEQGWADDPAFTVQDLHCYHGTTLTVDNETFGTVCFVSNDPRDEPLPEGETMFAELIARLLEHELEYDRQQTELNRRESLLNVFGRVLRHNLRNDMTVIRGLVRMQMDESGSTNPYLEEINETITELYELGETARQFESIETTQLKRQPLELMTLLEDVVSKIKSDFPSVPVSLNGPD